MLLAERHIEETDRGHDTSSGVFALAMAHADLVYWRELQIHLRTCPAEDVPAVKALVDVVSTCSSASCRASRR